MHTHSASDTAAQHRPASSLLDELTTKTVDPGYAEVAAQRTAAGEARRGGAGSFIAIALAMGVLVSLAARETRLRAPATARTRAALITETRRREAIADRLVADALAARRDLAAAQDAQLSHSRDGLALSRQLAMLEDAVGAQPVRGPGLVVRLSDAPPDAQDRDDPDDAALIRDSDVQQVVNALWAAGAEATAVNGIRVTALTAIRQAGEAILVDYRALRSPYEITALGDADTMEPALADSAAARRFHTFSEVYGLGYRVRRVSRLEVAAATITTLEHARRVGAA
ncbi:MAG: DUF881 domain-containing protein [Frankia sp.]|nr:DUF881 domain-containing protein [Frankia sp.]